MSDARYEFLDPAFLEAMNDIGRYGYQKYGEQSFQYRRSQGDTSRGDAAIFTVVGVIAAVLG
jgi:hypothetical protein